MIDEKKIEEAADIYIDKCIEIYEEERSGEACKTMEQPPCFGDMVDAFKAGIDWFLENLWHDAKEEPNEDEKLLVERVRDGKRIYFSAYYKDGYYFFINSIGYEDEAIKRDNKSRWLYIEDLTKGGK